MWNNGDLLKWIRKRKKEKQNVNEKGFEVCMNKIGYRVDYLKVGSGSLRVASVIPKTPIKLKYVWIKLGI